MRFKHIKKLLEEQQLNEVNMSPGALRKFADSSEADGIRAGFEAELVFTGLGGAGDDYESEPDYDADESPRSISDVIEFFSNDDYGNGMSPRQASRLENDLDEAYYEWRDEKMMSEFTYEAEDRIRDQWLEERPMIERIHAALTDGMELSDEDADRIISVGKNKKPSDEESDDYQKYLDAEEIAESILEEEVEKSLNDQDGYYDSALETFSDNFYIDDDRSFWTDNGWRWMSDIANHFDLSWPIWTENGDTPNGEYDYGNAENLAQSLAKALGVKVKASGGYHGARRDDTTWIIEPDSSLDADESDNMPCEIVSPPMPLKDCLKAIENFFTWAEDNGAYTNSSTGFHMGVSLPHTGGKTDFIKLALFLGDEYVLDQFRRKSNTYCEAAIKKIRQKIGSSHNKEQIAGALELMRSNLLELATRELKIVGAQGFGKYTSINPHLSGDGNGYIEFRSAGNTNYHEDIDKLKNTLLRYARAMHIASRPDLEREEYYTKLYKLISPSGDDSLNLFAQFTTGSISKDQLKKQWADAQLSKELGPDKKTNWKLYNRTTGQPVQGAEYSNYTKKEALASAKAKYYYAGASMEEFQSNYELRDVGTNTGRWSIIRRDNNETLEIIDAPTRGEALEKAYDKYTDVIPFYAEPFSGEQEPEPKLSPRGKLAKRIKQPKSQTASNRYEIIDRRTGEVVTQYRAADADDAGDAFNNWLRNQGLPADTENYGYRPEQTVQDVPMDVAQNFNTSQARSDNGVPMWELFDRMTGHTLHTLADHTEQEAHREAMSWLRSYGAEQPSTYSERFGVRPKPATPGSTSWRDQLAQTIRGSAPRSNFELYRHETPNQVFHTMRNATADEVRDYISNQEAHGMPAGTLRVRQA